MKRSELKPNMYVRIIDHFDNDKSFWSRLFKGRYFQVDAPAEQPDNSGWWEMTSGILIFYSVNYALNADNEIMEPISEIEAKNLSKSRTNIELMSIGRKIERQMKIIEDLIDDAGCDSINLFDVSGKENLTETLECNDDVEEDDIDEICKEWDDLCILLDKLTELEDKYIREKELPTEVHNGKEALKLLLNGKIVYNNTTDCSHKFIEDKLLYCKGKPVADKENKVFSCWYVSSISIMDFIGYEDNVYEVIDDQNV